MVTAWLASSVLRIGYCDEAIEDMGGTDSDMAGRLQHGQYWETGQIFNALWLAIQSRAAELEAEESDDDDDDDDDDSDSNPPTVTAWARLAGILGGRSTTLPRMTVYAARCDDCHDADQDESDRREFPASSRCNVCHTVIEES